MRSGASSYCTRQGYRVAAGGEPLTPRHAHVEHPQQNRTLPHDAPCRRTSHAMVAHAQSVSGRQHLPDACQSQVNNAWHGRERSTSDNPRCQFNSRHGHTESCRECRTTPEPKCNPPWPHPTCQCKHAWPRRDLERSGMPICRQTTYAMPAQRVALGQTTPS